VSKRLKVQPQKPSLIQAIINYSEYRSLGHKVADELICQQSVLKDFYLYSISQIVISSKVLDSEVIMLRICHTRQMVLLMTGFRLPAWGVHNNNARVVKIITKSTC